jgi:hypothetical protein
VASAGAVSPLPVDLGDGVVLRHYEMADLDALWDAIEVERARLGEWMPFIRDAKTIDDERSWLETQRANLSRAYRSDHPPSTRSQLPSVDGRGLLRGISA